MLLEKIIIEGIMPERAMNKLKRAGICIYHAKKIKKNQILLSVSPKDVPKAFAICPEICYNISVYSVYTSKRAGAEGLLSLINGAKKRVGCLIGAAALLLLPLLCSQMVFKVEITGSDCYKREVLAALQDSGIAPYKPYDARCEEIAAAKILTLKDVSYCSVTKKGSVVWVDVRLSAFTEPDRPLESMTAKHGGTVETIAVLRGTPLKAAGDTVSAGEELVGGYLETPSGERTAVFPIARVTLACVYEAEVTAESEAEALALATLEADGEIIRKECSPTESGFFVTVEYRATETIGF